MYLDSELLPISALSHLLFCERRAALVHIEQVWAENWLTVEGRQMHKKAHDGPREVRDGVVTVRGLALCSYRLGLVGKADVVEISNLRFQIADLDREDGDESGTMHVRPIEYKRGRPKKDDSDRVQVCAQALCLEEMIGVSVPAGSIYYGQQKRRTEVVFDQALRQRTEEAARRLHELIDSRITPVAYREPKCDRCSLLNICLPHAMRPRRTASQFLERQWTTAVSSEGPELDL